MQVVWEQKGRGKTGVWPPLHLQLIKHQLQEKPHGHAFVAAEKMLLCHASFFPHRCKTGLILTVSYHQKGQSCSLPPPGRHSHVTYITSAKKRPRMAFGSANWSDWKLTVEIKELARDLQSHEWPDNRIILRLHNTRGPVFPPPPLGLLLHRGPSVVLITLPSRRDSMGSWLSS